MTSVVIIGGGPAGCATALALYAHGIVDVSVIEAGDYAAQRVGESLPPAIATLFMQCGIYEAFKHQQHAPCVGSCSVWGSAEPGHNDFISAAHGPGWHVDRRRFERFLADQVRERGMRLHTKARFEQVQRLDSGRYEVQFNDGGGPSQLTCDWVIDAGGVQALLASRLGARRTMLDKMLGVARFAQLGADQRLGLLSHLEAVEHGWWYAAGLPDGRAIVMLASDPATLKARALATPDAWLAHLQQCRHLSEVLGAAQWCDSKLTVLLAASSLLQPCAGPGWLAVGDAASCFDPITATGIYKAFANGIAAARAVALHGQDQLDGPAWYNGQIQSQFRAYQQQRLALYSREQRWPQASFWRERHAMCPDV